MRPAQTLWRYRAEEAFLIQFVLAMAEAEISKLPEFARPPLVETVLSAQFEPLAEMGSAHFGVFWPRVRSRFSKTEEKLALEPVVERFNKSPFKRGPRVRFETREGARPERIWFVNEPGTEMIQLQVDRFIKNWRKAGEGDVYPRYERVVKPSFDRDFAEFKNFAKAESLGVIQMNQCEVTYVNHLVAGDLWQGWPEAAKIFSFLGGLSAGLEDGSFVLRFPIAWQGEQVGRLVVEIQPALRATDEKQMYVMNLTARGQVGAGTDFLDIGRRAVVMAFAELTTPAMHEVWGRR